MPSLRIIVATDLSIAAQQAAERAAWLCQQHQGSLQLLHAINLTPLQQLRQLLGLNSDDIGQRMVRTAQDSLWQMAARLASQYSIRCDTELVTCSLLSAIDTAMQAVPPPLLVCADHGENVVKHYSLGSTALDLLYHNQHAMLLVKQPPRQPYRKVMVAIDFSAMALRALDKALALAPDAHFHLFHAVVTPFEGQLRYAGVEDAVLLQYQQQASQQAIQQLRQLRASLPIPAKRVQLDLVQGSATQHLLHTAQRHGCDLLALGKQGDGLLSAWQLGSMCRHVIIESTLDVLAVG